MTYTIKPSARIIHGFNAILGGVRALGADAARDTLSTHQDMIADLDMEPDRLEELLLETISDAIRTAGDAYEHGFTRCIITRDLARASAAHFSWDDSDGEPIGATFASTVLHATRSALGIPVESCAARDVIAERQRQIEGEEFTPEHDDDAHVDGFLARAGACYARYAHDCDGKSKLPAEWPFDEAMWKPTTARRDLVKAAALILAEIERLDRQEGTE